MRRPAKSAFWGGLFILLAVMLSGCAGKQAQQLKVGPEPRPQRIVSLSPSVTEILYGIDAWPQVIAVSQLHLPWTM